MIGKNLKKRTVTSLILFFLLFLTFISEKVMIITLLLIGILSLLEFFNLAKKIFRKSFLLLGFNLIVSLYLFIFLSLFVFISNFIQLKIILFLLLFGCIASDLGGYFFGKIFKGPKLTKISPNKTYSGVIGSITFTIFIFYIFFYFSNNNFSIKILIPAIITSIACQIGDLQFPTLKEKHI